MFPDLKEFMVKEHQKWLKEQARQIALQREYGRKKGLLVKFTFSYLAKIISIFM